MEKSFWKTCKFLEHCLNNGITFNPEKIVFAGDAVNYVGFEVTMDSVKPSSTILMAIKEFPAPTNITQMRSFFWLINQVSFTFSMKDAMALIRVTLTVSSIYCALLPGGPGQDHFPQMWS